MLFFAVFCGSLAEYRLEHKIEQDREKKYIRSLVNDLVADSIDAGNYLQKNIKREKISDSLLKIYSLDLSNPVNSRLLYHFFLKTTSLPQFDPHTATMTQLKSSGSLRLVHDQKISEQILAYDQQTIFLQKINLAYGEVYRDVWAAAFPVLHVNLFYDSAYADYDDKVLIAEVFPPVNCSQEKLDVFFGFITRQLTYTRQQISLLRRQVTAAHNLAEVLKKEYHLD